MKNFQTSDSSPSKALHNTLETGTIEVSKTSAAEPQTRPQAARLEPLVYRVEEIAQLLAISSRAAYNLCNSTRDFRVLRHQHPGQQAEFRFLVCRALRRGKPWHPL